MKLWQSMTIQVVAIVIAVSAVLANFVEPGWKPPVVLVMGTIQAVTAYFAHYHNPDGTKALVSYVKKV